MNQTNDEEYWATPANTSQETDWGAPNRPGSNLRGFGLGLGQFAGDFISGQGEGIGEAEPGVPEHWKPARIRKENRPERQPIFNLENYINPEEKTAFNVGRYGPALGLFAAGAAPAVKPALKYGLKGAELGLEGAKKGGAKVAELTGKLTEKVAPKLTEATKKGVESGKKVYEKATARNRKIEALESQEREAKKQLHELKKETPENQIERGGDIQKIIDIEQEKRNLHAKGIESYRANEQVKKTGALTKSLTEAKEKITKPLKEEWDRFGDSEPMYKAVLEPIEIKGFSGKYGNPKEYASEGLQEIIAKTVGTKEHVPAHFDVIHGAKPEKTVHHQQRPLIKDYLALYRNAREEATDWTSVVKNKDTLPDQKKLAGAKAKKLRMLASEARKKLEGYLDPNELKELKRLEHRFEQEEIPWRESPLLKNATERHATLPEKDFHQALINENYPHLTSKLLEQFPNVRENLAAFDLRGFEINNPKNIRKLLDSDQGRALPENLQKDLKGIADSLESEKELLTLRKSITKGEVTNEIHSKELKGILEKYPELAKPFTSDMDRRRKIRELQNHLKELGLSKEEIKANTTTFEKIIGAINTTAGYIPGAGAVKKLTGLLMG